MQIGEPVQFTDEHHEWVKKAVAAKTTAKNSHGVVVGHFWHDNTQVVLVQWADRVRYTGSRRYAPYCQEPVTAHFVEHLRRR